MASTTGGVWISEDAGTLTLDARHCATGGGRRVGVVQSMPVMCWQLQCRGAVLNARPDRSPRKALKQPAALAPAAPMRCLSGTKLARCTFVRLLLPTPVSLSAPERALVE